MPAGTRDFGLGGESQLSQNEIASSEIASRSGRPISQYPSGQIILVDDFNSNMSAWTASGGGTAVIDSSATFSPPSSVKLTTQAIQDAVEILTRPIRSPIVVGKPSPSESKIGIEFRYLAGDTPAGTVQWTLEHKRDPNNGAAKYYAGLIRYLAGGTRRLEIPTGGINVTLAEPFTIPVANPQLFWHSVKMVVDVKNDKYSWLVVDNMYYNLNQYIAANGSPAPANTGQWIAVSLSAESNTAVTAKTVWFDDLILTFNEP